jgi:hypothetical protein
VTGDIEHDAESINAIAPDVLQVLARRLFFQLLDDQMSPADGTEKRLRCDGTYAISTPLLERLGFEAEEIPEIRQVLLSKGGCCDCEILFNVAEESRLKSEYWRAKAAKTGQGDWPLHHWRP